MSTDKMPCKDYRKGGHLCQGEGPCEPNPLTWIGFSNYNSQKKVSLLLGPIHSHLCGIQMYLQITILFPFLYIQLVNTVGLKGHQKFRNRYKYTYKNMHRSKLLCGSVGVRMN